MSSQPLDFAHDAAAKHASATSLDGLRDLFRKTDDEIDVEFPEQNEEPSAPDEAVSGAEEQCDSAADAESREVPASESGSTEITLSATESDTEEIFARDRNPDPVEAAGKLSRGDLVNVLEGFVNLIRNTDDLSDARNFQPAPLDFDPTRQTTKINPIHVDDKTLEVEELRCLLVEAQETIIRLLTERVEDRARISQLETELKLLPDLQAQADRAIAVAMNTDDFRRELTKVKFELERVRLTKVRQDLQRTRRSWWAGMRGWLFKHTNI